MQGENARGSEAFMSETVVASPPGPARRLSRLLAAVRWDEVLVLQGAPMIGAMFAIAAWTMTNIFLLAVFAVGSCCLVGHVFVLNDWSGIHGDLRDPNRAARTFAAKGVSRTEFGFLAIALLASSLLLFALLGRAPLGLALAIAGLSALYSAPLFHVKGIPLLNSLLHLAGGAVHFWLGYATFAAIDARGIAVGCFFGLVFTAGHLTHEARDCEGDELNVIRTNAVAFGRTRSFFAGLALFTSAYVLLVALAAYGVVPRVLMLAAVLYPMHLVASLQALRAGLCFESLSRLQRCYRALYAVIGVMMVVAMRLA
jgi:4-hydroxybenzoate polyprenyltransferase